MAFFPNAGLDIQPVLLHVARVSSRSLVEWSQTYLFIQAELVPAEQLPGAEGVAFVLCPGLSRSELDGLGLVPTIILYLPPVTDTKPPDKVPS